jgi:trehalose 6-phosphate phosphatase
MTGDGAGWPAVPVPRTPDGRAGLTALLRAPGRALIGLDYDGTLSPIVTDPARARALPRALAALRAIAPRAGTVAVITGRGAVEAVSLGGLDGLAGLIVLGHYGRQRYENGTLTVKPAPPGVAVARRELPGVLATAGALDGTWTEDKGDALAVHTRRTADPAAALERLHGPLSALAARTGLRLEPGRMVLELRPGDADKGQAVRDLAAERDPGAILYCGDDLGDLPAFDAVAQLRAAGTPGLTVCSRSAEVATLAERADLVVDGPDGVAALLEAVAAAWFQGG